MRSYLLLLCLLPGCSVAIFGDAAVACDRVKSALANHAALCHIADANHMPDCDLVIGSSGTNDDAADCERALTTWPCDDLSVPALCRLDFAVLP